MFLERWVGRLTVVLLVFLVSGAVMAGCAPQASYPTKAIEFVVPWPAGGGTDVVARIMVKHLSAELGVPVNVVNKPGASGVPGAMAALAAAPDGHTLLVTQPSTSSMHVVLKDLPGNYKIEERTFGPMYAEGTQALVIGGKSPWNTLRDVAEAAKKDPGAFTWGFQGGATTGDFVIMQFLEAAGVDVTKTKRVSFDGTGPMLTAVAGGHVMLGTGGVASVRALHSSGDLKVPVVTGDKRVPGLPNVPSAKEAGFPGVNLVSWYSLSGPVGLPKNVQERLDAATKKMVENQEYAKELAALGGDQASYVPADQVRQKVKEEIEFYKAMSAKLSGTK